MQKIQIHKFSIYSASFARFLPLNQTPMSDYCILGALVTMIIFILSFTSTFRQETQIDLHNTFLEDQTPIDSTPIDSYGILKGILYANFNRAFILSHA